MRYWSRKFEALGSVSKTELQNAVNATDSWIDSNQASFNAALPQPARDELTASQKTLLFCAVALMRVDPGNTALLSQVFGEVD
jgi:hypothetical protein